MARPVRVLVVGPKYSAPNSRGGMASVVAIMRERRDARVRVRTVATYVDDRPAIRIAVGVLGMLRSALLILTRRVDVVHVHLAHKGSVARKAVPLLAARAAGVPAIVHAHSYNFAAWFDELSPAWQTIVRRVLPAHRWIVLGDALGRQYAAGLRLPDERVRVLRNPANLPEYPAPHLPPDNDEVRAVFLGRQGERKGSYDLIKAIAELSLAVRSQLRVVAAGDGDVEQVRAAARAAGITDVLEVRGWVGPAERDTLLARSEIFLLPSYDEALPMALLEAMAWGLAPLTTPVGGIPEVITDGVDGMFVPPGDHTALACALEKLVLDQQRRRSLGTAAQAKATEFDTERWFESLVDEWVGLAGRNG